MEIILSSKLQIKKPSPEVLKHLKETLSIPNPMYYQLMRMGNRRALYGVNEYIPYYKELDGDLYCGRGLITPLTAYLEKIGLAPKVTDLRVKVPISKPFKCDITLREYQQPIVNEITKASHGVIRLDTGFGKSIIALKLIEALQQKTLIIVPRDHLLEQFKTDLKKLCGIEAGIVKGGMCEIKDVTLATIQTLDRLNKKGELKNLKDTFGMVIVDEAHLYITTSRLSAIQTFRAHYFYGMTATPARTDGQDKAIFFTFGPIVTDHKLPQAKPKVVVFHSPYPIPVREYSQIIDEQVICRERNSLIAQIARKQTLEGRKVLILTKRVDHISKILAHYPAGDGVIPIYADMRANEKNSLLDDLRKNNKDFSLIIGTFSLLSTGTDIPALDCLILAGDLKSHVLQGQSVGRILRLFEGKPQPIIFDIHDKNNPILHNQYKCRLKQYNANEWEVVDKEI